MQGKLNLVRVSMEFDLARFYCETTFANTSNGQLLNVRSQTFVPYLNCTFSVLKLIPTSGSIQINVANWDAKGLEIPLTFS